MVTEADEVAANMRVDLSRILTFRHAVEHLTSIGITAETHYMQVRDNIAEALLERANAFRRHCDKIVRENVHLCLSSLVSTLASGYGANQLVALTEQAFELTTPIVDYRSAAEEAGWQDFRDNMVCRKASAEEREEDGSTHRYADGYEEACQKDDIEPHDREVYEHWAVSDWLADKLEAKGEKVDRDFAGLIVWARTTTAQAIAADWVIEQIAADLAREYGA